MINKLSRFIHAFWTESIKRLPYILIILALLLLWQGYENSRSAENIAKTLVAQSNQRDKNLKRLINDNAQQTSILCALILKNNLTPQEQDHIQEICKRRIKESTPSEATSTPSSTSTSSSTAPVSVPSPQSSPQPSPQSSPAPAPTEPPKKDEGLIPDSIPLIGPLL